MNPLALFLLDIPHLELSGKVVNLQRRKALALLAYLSVSGRSHSRETLAAFFWPESRLARGNLRRILSDLRGTLGPDYLAVDRQTVSLASNSPVWVDVLEFRRLAHAPRAHGHSPRELCPECLAQLEQATALYRGDFLSGFTLTDSPEFDDWQRFESDQLRGELIGAIECLGRSYAQQGDSQTAINYARRWVALDPLSTDAQRFLLQLYVTTGQMSAVTRQYNAFVEQVQEALGLSAPWDIGQLIHSVRVGSESPLEAVGPMAIEAPVPQKRPLPRFLTAVSSPGCAGENLFVAREHRLSLLERHLQTALSGRGHLVFVTGEAGSGKSALLRAFSQRAQDAHPDLIVSSGVCDVCVGKGDPYLPFRDVMSMLSGDVESRWASGEISRDHALRLWRLFPDFVSALTERGPSLIDTFIPGSDLADRAAVHYQAGAPWQASLRVLLGQESADRPDQTRIFEEYTAVLRALAAGHPLMLLLDDLQWADPSSVSLLFHLAQRIRRSPILILAAYRPEDLDGVAAQPLQDMVREIGSQFDDSEVSLDRLPTHESRTFVFALLDRQPNRLGEEFRRAFFHQSRGHALFTVELLRHMQERGDLVMDLEGHWVVARPVDWNALPTRVENVIERRINRLDRELRDILAVACVEGEVFSAEVVAQALGLEIHGVIRRLSGELHRQHHLVDAQGANRIGTRRLSRYRFHHNLIQRYLYRKLDAVERVHLHEAVALALETWAAQELETTDQLAASLARHWQEAGQVEKAVQAYYQAGRRALRLSANHEAIAHLRRGLTLLDTLPASPERTRQELDFQIALGIPVTATCGFASAEAGSIYRRSRALINAAGLSPEAFPALYGLWRYHALRCELAAAGELADQLLELSQQFRDRDLELEAHRALGVTRFYQGDLLGARLHLEASVSLYSLANHRSHAFVYGHDPAVSCLGYLSHTLWLLGYPDQALTTVDDLLELADSLDHPFSYSHATVFGAARTHQLCGNVKAAYEQTQVGLAVARQRRFPQWIARAAVLQGWARAMQGQVDAGVAQIQTGIDGWLATGTRVELPYYWSLLASIHLGAGQIPAGFTAVMKAQNALDSGSESWWEAEVVRLRGELQAKQMAPDAAACLAQAVTTARAKGAGALEVRAALSLARFWQSQQEHTKARQLLSSVLACPVVGVDHPDLLAARALHTELTGCAYPSQSDV